MTDERMKGCAWLRMTIRRDYIATVGRAPSNSLTAVFNIFTLPGMAAVFLYRIQQWLTPKSSVLARILRQFNHWATGADFALGSSVGPGIQLRHPSGIVIGVGAVVGENCVIMQQVTLGESLGRNGEVGYPRIGDHVFLGAGSKIIGSVQIGNNARIGANSVVLTNVPEDATAVGIPARVVHS